MVGELRVALEVGPKGKRVVAVAPDWPGLERGGRTVSEAVDRLVDYLPRYTRVAEFADESHHLEASSGVRVVEEYAGTGSTDFWGISFAFSSFDRADPTADELERELALMQGCWSFFDGVRGRVSAEMRKGPRGGGRDRDRIVRHTLVTEQEWAEKLGVRTDRETSLAGDGLTRYRADYCAAIREHYVEGRSARSWPLRFLIRHTAFHTMDHAWEMEDKDLGRGD
jgi:hypothetical protein